MTQPLLAPTVPKSPSRPGPLARWWRALVEPIAAERRRLNADRYAALPAAVRGPRQVVGVTHHSCGATHGVMERCDFACTSCYLGSRANATPPLGEAAVLQQLDALRAFLGPQGKAQITSGEVTLLPLETLGLYVSYARSIGLDPMVMTHGQRFLKDPDYLRTLVRDHGLEKISIHVDVTQRGRDGWKIGLRERDLHPVRERYARLIRQIRRQTGRKLHAAHTVTVTEQNLDDVAAVTRWVSGNADAFRMISFQPVAEVGRTRDRRIARLTLDDVWSRICDGLGHRIHRHAMHFGHPECHILAPLVLLDCGEHRVVIETARQGRRWDRSYLSRLLRAIGGFTVRGKSRAETVIGFLSLCLRQPLLLLETPFYAAHRAWGLRAWIRGALGQLLRGRPLRIRPLAIVVHKFMSPDELETDLGRERLAACTFQVPVGDDLVPMCRLNATALRSQLNERLREGRAPAGAMDEAASAEASARA